MPNQKLDWQEYLKKTPNWHPGYYGEIAVLYFTYAKDIVRRYKKTILIGAVGAMALAGAVAFKSKYHNSFDSQTPKISTPAKEHTSLKQIVMDEQT